LARRFGRRAVERLVDDWRNSGTPVQSSRWLQSFGRRGLKAAKIEARAITSEDAPDKGIGDGQRDRGISTARSPAECNHAGPRTRTLELE
jgi:hypothetical protein